MVDFFDSLFSYPVQLLLGHGYLALFIWSILEGEIGLMLAGWLASEGRVFSYQGVIIVAMAGAMIGDTSVFLTGRIFKKKVARWLQHHPDRKKQADRYVGRYGPWVIIFERFIYGTHIPVLLSIGMTGFSFWRFFLFDMIGIVLWAFAFVSIGYRFGNEVIQLVIFAQKNLLLVFILLGIFIYGYMGIKEDTNGK